jgi:hypothetical protein
VRISGPETDYTELNCSWFAQPLQANVGIVPPLKTSGDYMHHLLYQLVTLHFVFMGLVWF